MPLAGRRGRPGARGRLPGPGGPGRPAGGAPGLPARPQAQGRRRVRGAQWHLPAPPSVSQRSTVRGHAGHPGPFPSSGAWRRGGARCQHPGHRVPAAAVLYSDDGVLLARAWARWLSGVAPKVTRCTGRPRAATTSAHCRQCSRRTRAAAGKGPPLRRAPGPAGSRAAPCPKPEPGVAPDVGAGSRRGDQQVHPLQPSGPSTGTGSATILRSEALQTHPSGGRSAAPVAPEVSRS